MITNKSLFSEHYLTHRLPEYAEWTEAAALGARDRLRAIYAAKQATLATANEAQTEEDFIKPVLDLLGWRMIVQAKSRSAGILGRPDYALFADEAQYQAANRVKNDQEKFWPLVAAIGDAKRWDRPLSARVDDPGDNSDPNFQMVRYVRDIQPVKWGVLTNGRLWRLYTSSVSSAATQYYEIDLIAALGSDSLDEFKRFWLFFRAAAYVPDPVAGVVFPQRVLDGSVQYARTVGDELKRLVFEEVFSFLAGGFIQARQRAGQDATSELICTETYTATLSLLYKLLFLLYAEARGLLPVTLPGYRDLSLSRAVGEVETMIKDGRPLGSVSARIYANLIELFKVIDVGDPGLGVPKYNGGLFSDNAPTNQYLRHNKIADDKLARAIFILAHLDGERIDFGYLDVRELGSIYEGLLEYRLVVDDAATGIIHLENDKGERRNLGAYYTPGYIVQTIVAQTLDPILKARETQYNAAMDALAALTPTPLPNGEALSEGQRARADLAKQAVEALLNIKVCDPAMGSGHFLVGAVDFLTDSVIEIIERRRIAHPDESPESNPILAFLNDIRQGIAADLKAQGLPAPALTDTQLLMRVVMKRCIYGVDLNALAVELAKLSLWLHTFTSGAPLSFLDHHLRAGNSLLGSTVRDVSDTIREKLPLFGGPFAGLLGATGLMAEVARLADATMTDVKRSEKLYSEFETEIQPYKALLNLWASQHFNNADARDLIALYADDALSIVSGKSTRKLTERDKDALKAAQTLARTHSFFHWELEFPEVFIDLDKQDWAAEPGFDAVIGNPPYVRQERIQPSKPFLAARYQVYDGTADLFLYFYELGLRLLKAEHRLGFITSGTYMNSNSAKAFRAFIQQRAAFETAINFGENQPFIGAEMVYPTIAILRKGQPTRTFHSLFIEDSLPRQKLPEAITQPTVETLSEVLAMNEWRFQPAALTELFKKITQEHQILGKTVNGQIYYGIKTGLNEAFVIDKATKMRLIAEHTSSAYLIQPMFRGEDLRPWYTAFDDQYLIFTYHGLKIEDYPAIHRYLETFRSKLEKRATTNTEWFELQTTISYKDAFNKSKLVWPEIAKLPRFSIDHAGYFANNKCYFVVSEPYSSFTMLSILQSRIAWFFLSQVSTPLRLRAGLWQYQLFRQFVERLPIPDLTADQESTLAEIAETITAKARERYAIDEGTRRRITSDFSADGGKLNDKLGVWWRLERPADFQAEIKKAFKRTIPVKERDEWDHYLADQRAQHVALTDAIITLETRMNGLVYDAFKLNADERTLIETATKYPYGEV